MSEETGEGRRVTIEPGGPIEITGYEADDVVKILKGLGEQTSDAAQWRPET